MARNKYPEITIGRILEQATRLFMEKGYDNTTIQDLIDSLGDLSKGAIYHHFKSKEEILNAVLDRLYGNQNELNAGLYERSDLNGMEKLKLMFENGVNNPIQFVVAQAMPSYMNNPKMLAKQLDTTLHDLAPNYIEPIIREGIADGSIQSEYSIEAAEVIALLTNVWLNPMIFDYAPEELVSRCRFYQKLLKSIGLDVLDDDMVRMIGKINMARKENKE